MPIRTAALVALLALAPLALTPVARADSTLAVSGPYTLTPSLVEADAAYWEWAAGHALAPDARRLLARLDVARFQRDPAWTVRVLTGEQKNLPFFRSLPPASQAPLRRTALSGLARARDNRLTPDEARQLQAIVTGAPPPITAPVGTPADAGDARLPLHSGAYTLTPAMVDDDLAVWQLVAGRPLAPADRWTVAAVDADIFRRDPAWLTANMRQVHKALPRLRRGDAVSRAGLRLNNLVAVFCTPARQHLSPDEAARMQALVGRYVPIVGVDAPRRRVLTARDVDAWLAAIRFVAAQAHAPTPSADLRDNLVRLARDPATLGTLAESEVAAMECNWAAFEIVWPHLNAARRAQVLNARLARVRQAGAGNPSVVAAVALQACQDAAGEYPYALDPRLEAYKAAMEMRMGLFRQNMMQYNTQVMTRGQENYEREQRGEGPDPRIIPLPVP